MISKTQEMIKLIVKQKQISYILFVVHLILNVKKRRGAHNAKLYFREIRQH